MKYDKSTTNKKSFATLSQHYPKLFTVNTDVGQVIKNMSHLTQWNCVKDVLTQVSQIVLRLQILCCQVCARFNATQFAD